MPGRIAVFPSVVQKTERLHPTFCASATHTPFPLVESIQIWGLRCQSLLLLDGKVGVPPAENRRQFVVQCLGPSLDSKWAPFWDHCICWRLQKRLFTTWFTVDSTNPVVIASP
jgi:hypothetical protein